MNGRSTRRVLVAAAFAAAAGLLVTAFPPARAATADLVATVHAAFVVVFVDAATFVQSCF